MKTYCLNTEQINFIIQKLGYELEQNEDMIKDLKDSNEINAWKNENKFIKSTIKDLKLLYKHEAQVIIQKVELTNEQEDYMIESQLEQIRLARELK